MIFHSYVSLPEGILNSLKPSIFEGTDTFEQPYIVEWVLLWLQTIGPQGYSNDAGAIPSVDAEIRIKYHYAYLPMITIIWLDLLFYSIL